MRNKKSEIHPQIILSTILIQFLVFPLIGQMNHFDFIRPINGVSDKWHSLELPDEIFGKANAKLSDLRIYGITAENDTIEAPYLINILREKEENFNIPFKVINNSKNSNGYFYTFAIDKPTTINQISLDFLVENFNWKCTLEGSHDQKEWFTILEDYRIVSIKNNNANYQFSTLNFPSANYPFFRLLVHNQIDPKFKSAKINLDRVSNVKHRIFESSFTVKNDDEDQETIINIDLGIPLPVSYLKIDVDERKDYYRPISIQYLVDSTKTEKGFIYNYRSLTHGILNSTDRKPFESRSVTSQKLRIFIQNYDNAPLNIKDVKVRGYVHQLIARFDQPAKYFLAYSNAQIAAPRYDLIYNKEQIPTDLTNLQLGSAIAISKGQTKNSNSLFENEIWLWVIMAIIALVLGWFSLRMINNKVN